MTHHNTFFAYLFAMVYVLFVVQHPLYGIIFVYPLLGALFWRVLMDYCKKGKQPRFFKVVLGWLPSIFSEKVAAWLYEKEW